MKAGKYYKSAHKNNVHYALPVIKSKAYSQQLRQHLQLLNKLCDMYLREN